MLVAFLSTSCIGFALPPVDCTNAPEFNTKTFQEFTLIVAILAMPFARRCAGGPLDWGGDNKYDNKYEVQKKNFKETELPTIGPLE